MIEQGGSFFATIFKRGKSAATPQDEPNPIDLEEGSEEYIKSFRLPAEVKAGLNENELKMLDLFRECAPGISELYLIQRGNSEMPNFYPPRITKRQILKAAANNPEITAPDTIVRRNQDGTLEPISMYLAYAGPIRRTGIILKLKEAAGIAVRDGKTQLATYLGVKATSFENGNSELAHQAWMEIKEEPPVDVAIGLYDTNTDPYGIKESWELFVTVLDKRLTAESQPFADAYTDWVAKDTGIETPKVKMRIAYPIVIAGQAYGEGWTANNLGRPDWRNKYGSKFIFLETVFETDFRQKSLRAFRDYIDPNRVVGIQDSLVKRARRRLLIGHEISHSVDIPSDLNARLNEYASLLKELYCDLLALDGYSHIVDPVLFEPREQEMALASFLSEGVLEYRTYKSPAQKRKDYYFSNSVILTRLIAKNAVQIDPKTNRITWSNPRLAYAQISELRREVQHLIHHGSFKNAEDFIATNLDQEVYRPVALKGSSNFAFLLPRKVPEPENISEQITIISPSDDQIDSSTPVSKE